MGKWKLDLPALFILGACNRPMHHAGVELADQWPGINTSKPPCSAVNTLGGHADTLGSTCFPTFWYLLGSDVLHR